ncbi:MAG: glycosyltransferase, partial [Patescibacteria group bacterium]|nr:glycosyltransferase [Patescibacteria group bacterium]
KPNVDAVKWLKEDIYPLLKKEKIVVKVVGSNPPKEVLDLGEKGFDILGFMSDEDLDKLFSTSKVFISPLRFGAGFKGKIAKSISRGLPVVSTKIGAEGMGFKNNENILIADDANSFAESIIKLYLDQKLWEKISKNSIKHAKENYSYENAKDKISGIL